MIKKDEKWVSFKAKRRGQRGPMYYTVYFKGPSIPGPYNAVTFDDRDDAKRLVTKLEADGHIKLRVSSGKIQMPENFAQIGLQGPTSIRLVERASPFAGEENNDDREQKLQNAKVFKKLHVEQNEVSNRLQVSAENVDLKEELEFLQKRNKRQ